MPDPDLDPDSDLPPPGSRWGAGAQSVLPYLTKSLQARPALPPAERHPEAPLAYTPHEGDAHPQA